MFVCWIYIYIFPCPFSFFAFLDKSYSYTRTRVHTHTKRWEDFQQYFLSVLFRRKDIQLQFFVFDAFCSARSMPNRIGKIKDKTKFQVCCLRCVWKCVEWMVRIVSVDFYFGCFGRFFFFFSLKTTVHTFLFFNNGGLCYSCVNVSVNVNVFVSKCVSVHLVGLRLCAFILFCASCILLARI